MRNVCGSIQAKMSFFHKHKESKLKVSAQQSDSKLVQIKPTCHQCLQYKVCYTRHLSALLTSGVPQNVDVVPEGSIPSLQSPKSVKTIWPCKKPINSKLFYLNT